MSVLFVSVVAYVVAAPMEVGRYPANIDPALCPDYPICDLTLLFGIPPSMPEPLVPVSLPEVPISMPHAPPQNFYRPHEYPPGVHPSACPNFPFCNVSQIVLPLPGFSTRLYPPGVHPSACPNFPIC
ncbi:Cuticle protein 1 [Pseudolycoriella hygida]|uniref:Cuticle protein 1 n=1 Tax=Pseudolycoriella hygida TaxID=35572 RepID=A0A9Q0N9G5_9DIPT|nr:Cuticle protein 1 [Pseudolycoriella hygida]